MSTSPLVKFTKGSRSLTLSSGRYSISGDFVPPSTIAQSQYAESTSLNRFGGSPLVSQKYSNRPFDFGVHVKGSSEAEIRRAITDIQAFLGLAGDEDEPLYLEFNPVSDTPEPLWGQFGANYRYEVVSGDAIGIGETYFISSTRATEIPNCHIALTLKPFALGKKQRLASATGGIIEDAYGASDGISYGLRIPPATTNLFTNPVFGNSDYDNGWTAQAALSQVQISDGIFGFSDVELINTGTATQYFYQTLSAGTAYHALSIYCRRRDGGTVTTSDINLDFNNAPQTPTITSMNGGLYAVDYIATAGTAAAGYGIGVQPGKSVILCGAQLEAATYYTPLTHGDMLGCAWTGTTHASTSTRTAGRIRLTKASDTFNLAEGAFRVVLKWKFNYTFGAAQLILDTRDGSHATSFYLFYDQTADKFTFTDGVNTAVSTSAKTHAVGDTIVLHASYGPTSGVRLYENGVLQSGGGAYTPPSAGAYLYFGTDYTTGSDLQADISDMTIFDRELTAAQALNDYANIAQVIADNQRVAPIPWLWTKDGDDVVDNCDDSTNDNWCVCGGIPGNAKADTFYRFATFAQGPEVLMGNWETDTFYAPTGKLFFDFGGSADAACCGGAYYRQVIGTAVATIGTYPAWGMTDDIYRDGMGGKSFRSVVRIADTGTGLSIATKFSDGTNSIITDYKGITAGTAYKLEFPGDIMLPTYLSKQDDIVYSNLGIYVLGVRSSSSGTVDTDYAALFPSPCFLITGQSSMDTFVVNGYDVNQANIVSSGISIPTSLTGQVIELMPNKFNVLTVLAMTKTTRESIPQSYTTGFIYIKVVPRYLIL